MRDAWEVDERCVGGAWEVRGCVGLQPLARARLRVQDRATWRSADMRRFVCAISCCRGVRLRLSSLA